MGFDSSDPELCYSMRRVDVLPSSDNQVISELEKKVIHLIEHVAIRQRSDRFRLNRDAIFFCRNPCNRNLNPRRQRAQKSSDMHTGEAAPPRP